MSWFNSIGLIVLVVMMIPNIIYGVKHSHSLQNRSENPLIEALEQIGRYGCFILMMFNIPYTYFNFWFKGAFLTYVIINFFLCAGYYACWVIFWKKSNLAKAISLSLLPTFIFLFSGIILASIPLILFAILFGSCHIFISCKNVI